MKKIACIIIALALLAGIISFPPHARAEDPVQPEDTILGTVIAEVAEVWEEPSADSALLAECVLGDTVYIFYQLEEYYFVQLPGIEEIQGYMLAEYVETDPEEPIPTAPPATPEPTEEPTPEPTEEPTPEPTEEPTPEPTEETHGGAYSGTHGGAHAGAYGGTHAGAYGGTHAGAYGGTHAGTYGGADA